MKRTKVTLEDNGQDLLWLLVDENGLVIDAGPYQTKIWKGSNIPVWDDELFKEGQPCPIHNAYLKYGFLKYKIESIETI